MNTLLCTTIILSLGAVTHFNSIAYAQSSNCIDSDGGMNYDERGTVTVDFADITDSCQCYGGNGPGDYHTCDSGEKLLEWTCSSDGYASNHPMYDCPKGCYMGACRSEAVTTPTSTNLPSVSNARFLCDGDSVMIELSEKPQGTIALQYQLKNGSSPTHVLYAGGEITSSQSFSISGFLSLFEKWQIERFQIEFASCPTSNNLFGEGIRENCGSITTAFVNLNTLTCSCTDESVQGFGAMESCLSVDGCYFDFLAVDNNQQQTCFADKPACLDADDPNGDPYIGGTTWGYSRGVHNGKMRDSIEDKCKGRDLVEYSCGPDGYIVERNVICANGCNPAKGACYTQGQQRSSARPQIDGALPPARYEDDVLTNIEAFPNPFPDTNMNILSGKAASELYRRAVIGGYPDGEFKGSRLVNRAEAAKFLLLARLGSVSPTSNNGQFPDVADEQWYTSFVVTAANRGIINGYPDGMFRPANTVNTAEFLKMLVLTFDLEYNLPFSYSDVPSDAWFALYAGVAQKYDLFPARTQYLRPESELSREEVAVAIYQYLRQR